jgi:beta-glucanase (GH16 family)
MLSRHSLGAVILATTVTVATAQTYAKCNLANGKEIQKIYLVNTDNGKGASSCAPNPGLSEKSIFVDFTKINALPPGWHTELQGKTEFTDKGLDFHVAKSRDTRNLISDFYIFFGSVELKLRTASGGGLASTAVMQSDIQDEIDFEAVGRAQDKIESAYFGKGNKASNGGTGAAHDSPGRSDRFYTYKIDWTPERIDWYIDGKIVRTLLAKDAKDGPNFFPQTPMLIKIGAWAPGDASANELGIVQWSGGPIDWSKGPFVMTLQSINVVNYSPAKAYHYSDQSGLKTGIKIEDGVLMGNGVRQASKVQVPESSLIAPSPTLMESSHITPTPASTDSAVSHTAVSHSAVSNSAVSSSALMENVSLTPSSTSVIANISSQIATPTTHMASNTAIKGAVQSTSNAAPRFTPRNLAFAAVGTYILQALL